MDIFRPRLIRLRIAVDKQVKDSMDELGETALELSHGERRKGEAGSPILK